MMLHPLSPRPAGCSFGPGGGGGWAPAPSPRSIKGPFRQQEAMGARARWMESKAVAGRVEIFSPHPDAVRRRREAEARQQVRLRELAELTGKATSSRVEDLPNVVRVGNVVAYERELKAAMLSSGRVVVHFKSAACQSCLRLGYRVKTVARRLPDVAFIVVDLGNGEGALAEKCREMGICSVPYFQVYTNRVLTAEGGWKDIPLLSVYDSPKDMRTCSIGGFRKPEKNEIVSRLDSSKSKVKSSEEHSKSAQNGLDLLRQAKVI